MRLIAYFFISNDVQAQAISVFDITNQIEYNFSWLFSFVQMFLAFMLLA